MKQIKFKVRKSPGISKTDKPGQNERGKKYPIDQKSIQEEEFETIDLEETEEPEEEMSFAKLKIFSNEKNKKVKTGSITGSQVVPESGNDKRKPNPPVLKKIWTAITIVLFLFGLYLLLAPFFPELEFLFSPRVETGPTDNDSELAWLRDMLNNTDNTITTDNGLIVKPDKIMIPSIGANVDLHYSSSDKALDLGAWLKSQGSLPGATGNTIITGHKFVYYSGQRPFYHLYRVQPGNNIYIYWRGQTYLYNVTENFIVDDSEVWIEAPASGSILTVYTCEGLDSAQRRVLRANFIKTVDLDDITIN